MEKTYHQAAAGHGQKVGGLSLSSSHQLHFSAKNKRMYLIRPDCADMTPNIYTYKLVLNNSPANPIMGPNDSCFNAFDGF
eukprot:5853231-Amphidinium_carterae.1